MLLILALLFFFLSSPLTAWAYFDPGFGGYLVNSIISLIVTGFAFISAAVIYFFRTVIGQKICLIILLSVMGLGSFFLGAFLHHTFRTLSADHPHWPGARIIDPQHIFKGYSLYNGKLIDEKGRVVKRWSSAEFGTIDKNGDYYGHQKHGTPHWGRYTWDDKVIWEKPFPVHHEIYLSPKGTIFTFTTETHDYNNCKVDFDIILEFDKNGKQLQRFSFWDHLKEFQPYHAPFVIDDPIFPSLSPIMIWHNLVDKKSPFDYFHLNSFFMIPPNALEGKNPAFRPGNWLISIFHGSMVFILDQDTKKILWHAVGNEVEGGLEGQHSASMLPDGNILLFDNGFKRLASRILIIDPLTLKIKWQYNNTDFFSPTEGFVQALPNGNFFVTESTKGHAFELTPDKKIVYEYYALDHLIYRMTRYPKEMIDHFLQK
jgi:Arylsulfotransferase (ASST)